MKNIPTSYFDKEMLKKEVCDIIDANGCIYYKVSRIAEPMSLVAIKVEMEFILNKDEDLEYYKGIVDRRGE